MVTQNEIKEARRLKNIFCGLGFDARVLDQSPAIKIVDGFYVAYSEKRKYIELFDRGFLAKRYEDCNTKLPDICSRSLYLDYNLLVNDTMLALPKMNPKTEKQELNLHFHFWRGSIVDLQISKVKMGTFYFTVKNATDLLNFFFPNEDFDSLEAVGSII